ncbi:MAG: flagellar biosynthesis protein FlgD [Pseudomonadales bacterium]|mgnify:FL=1|jgi:flagellar basal-body rod modification protein FlgD|nr:flagellar biosynthesis protein FlgD [Pseudomonadales bacterium]MBF77282.1 flagellar biosynthesis protein FlgD [Pseudomonadales bacterium]MEB3733298.1 flagellar hook assembly protein FlgD [Halopseudomonas pachastrellae]HCB43009.1 flagellar biosynthesis protein FlgD [Pseudomonas sp.]HCL40728.1 flagellar biosynthesis protein FlgD [Pseudomonas sp.]|tara:strand:+ start:14406 stop:15086 length:681 start_codon:yes stop_codon:yes gene_type:complete
MSISNVATGASALDQYQIDSDRFATGDELGKDQFLELLVAQMNNQDPLSPQENGEFIAQLAQFSTVEGIGNLNTSMESLLSGYQSSQALQASSMVGRTVIVPADQAVVDTEAGLEGQLALQQNSTNVFVNIYDQAGSLVKTINLGSQEAGMHDFTWDGTDASGNLAEPGIYTVEAMASIGGKNTQMATLLPANVDSVSLGAGGSGEMLLNVAGLGSISLSNVYAIK